MLVQRDKNVCYKEQEKKKNDIKSKMRETVNMQQCSPQHYCQFCTLMRMTNDITASMAKNMPINIMISPTATLLPTTVNPEMIPLGKVQNKFVHGQEDQNQFTDTFI